MIGALLVELITPKYMVRRAKIKTTEAVCILHCALIPWKCIYQPILPPAMCKYLGKNESPILVWQPV